MAEGDLATFRAEVRTTLLHEIGHVLGWDEQDLEERGWTDRSAPLIPRPAFSANIARLDRARIRTRPLEEFGTSPLFGNGSMFQNDDAPE